MTNKYRNKVTCTRKKRIPFGNPHTLALYKAAEKPANRPGEHAEHAIS